MELSFSNKGVSIVLYQVVSPLSSEIMNEETEMYHKKRRREQKKQTEKTMRRAGET